MKSFVKKIITGNLIVRAIIESRFILTPLQYKKGMISVMLSFVNALLDVATAACLLPFLFIMLNPQAINKNIYVHRFYKLTTIADKNNFLLSVAGLLFLLFLGKSIISVYINRYHSRYVFGVSADISKKVYEKYFAQSYLSFTKNNSATSARLIVNIPFEYAFNVLLTVINIFNELLIILFILIALFFYNFKIILLLSFLLFPILFFGYGFRDKKLSTINKRLKFDYDIILKKLFSGIDSFVDLKLNKRQNFYVDQFDGLNKKHAGDLAYLSTLQSSSSKIIELLVVSGICILFSFCILYVHNEDALIMQLSVFAVAVFRVMPSINHIFTNYVQLKTHSYTLVSLKESLSRTGEKTDKLPLKEILFEKKIKLQNINFAYPGSENICLKDLLLVINKGEKIGIAGKSGTGKTTLLHILMGLVDGYSGQIMIDEIELDKQNVSAWQNLVAYVPQSPVIIDAGLIENIILGNADETIDILKLNEVIQMAQLNDLEQSMRLDWKGQTGENGIRLSGGQKQRIVIARALYRDTPLLVLDEPFSNLDRQTETEIINIIDRLCIAGKTIIIISHHLSSLSHCDKVYELKNGTLVKQLLRRIYN